MVEPGDMIIPLLREMRTEISKRFDGVDARLEAIERAQNSFRQALTADSLLSKLVTGEFEQRIEAVEQYQKRIELLELKVQELEALK